VLALSRHRGVWNIETPPEGLQAKVIVNAAGAWADQIADLAQIPRQGLTCCRRTMLTVDGPTEFGAWPVVSDVAETFYFKPDGGRLLLSPADRTPLPPQDVQPDDLDVATAVDRFEAATTCTVKRVTHRWAGLRTLSPDEEPIVGFDLTAPDFLWAAGFAGFGVQAAFAAGRCAEALLTDSDLPAELAEHGVDLEQLSPSRLERSPSSPHGHYHGF
jgi:D-arginine dehydrogenase